MNLHLKVEQPGLFCCNDGQCIDSELVCDNVPHCNNGMDESHDICETIKTDDNYKIEKAPTDFENHNGELRVMKTEINVSLDIMDFVNIDNNKALFTLTFRNI